MIGRYSKPYSSQTIIKKYGDRYKIIQGSFKLAGYEEEIQNENEIQNQEIYKNQSYDYKLSQSLSRSRQKISEYILCNDFNMFCTFTIDPKKYNRDNLDLFIKDFSQFIRNVRRLKNYNISYVFIPELHKKGGWHLHGVMNIPLDLLQRFNKSDKLPKYIRDNIENLYDWKGYRDRFGYCCLEPIKDKNKTSSYVTKYIVKTLGEKIEKNKKVYFCSRGLKLADTIYKGQPLFQELDYDYVGDYVSVKWIENKKALFDLGFSDNIIHFVDGH